MNKAHLQNLVRIQPDNEARSACIRLDLNENGAGLPEDFVREVLSRVDADYLCTYPKYERLREKIGRSEGVSAAHISLGNGSDGAIKYIYDAIIEEGDRILVTDPTFAMYKVYADIFQADVASVAYRTDFSFPVDDFISRLSDGVKAAVIVNPNNPTGTALTLPELERIIQAAQAQDVLVLVDEAYHYFCEHTAMPLVGKYPNVIVLRTFSKLCALAATRIGYAAAHPDVIGRIEKVKPTYDVNGIGVLFAEALLDRPEIIRQMIAGFQSTKQYMSDRLAAEGIASRSGEANFILIDAGARAEEIVTRLKEERILVAGGFTQPYLANYVRVSIGKRTDMEAFLSAFLAIYRSGS